MNPELENEVVRRWQQGASRRRIARELKISRDSVSKILGEHTQGRAAGLPHPDLPTPPRRRGSIVDAYLTRMEELLARWPQITAVRVHEELRKAGYRGGYSMVRDRLRQLRPKRPPERVLRFETAPGAQAQMDYAVYDLDFSEEGRQRVNLFSYVLGYSRRHYLRFVERQDFETTVREHVRAFEHLGGVAATCLYDNMKVVVGRYEGDEPIYNTRFLAFATYYGYRPIACRPRRAQTKGKVERPFQFIEGNFLNGRSFRSLEHLNECLAQWLAEVADVRIHRETRRRPVDLHAEELPCLVPLPAQPYDTAEVVYRTVNAEGLVAYRQNLYSVPWRHIGEALAVRITESELIIYGPDLTVIACHRLLPRTTTAARSEQPEHRPREDQRQKEAWLQERFTELGPVAKRFLEGLFLAQRNGKDHAQRVLVLLEIYRRQDLQAALERAVRFGAFSFRAVERILAAQAQPRTPLEALSDQQQRRMREILDDRPVSPRPTSDYQQLYSQEPPHDASPPPEKLPGPAEANPDA